MDVQAFPATPSSERREGSSCPRAMSYCQIHQQDAQFYDPVSRPHFHAELIRSTTPAVPRASRTSVAKNVTTREAVLNEAIAEEKIAAEQRLKEEDRPSLIPKRLAILANYSPPGGILSLCDGDVVGLPTYSVRPSSLSEDQVRVQYAWKWAQQQPWACAFGPAKALVRGLNRYSYHRLSNAV
ncbi:hypothetical protein EDC04DRAFT_2599196 [Pisolithus marmoratus]|nr:hypothetical protein EDC04DRAFT_2599196 [Pisolithus marmoratus]